MPQFSLEQIISQSQKQTKIILAFTQLRTAEHSYAEPIRITNFDAVKAMEEQGIRFQYDTQVVTQLFQSLYQSWIALQGQPTEVQEQVINIMLDGIIQQIL